MGISARNGYGGALANTYQISDNRLTANNGNIVVWDAPNSVITRNLIQNSKGYGIQASGGGFSWSQYSDNAIIAYNVIQNLTKSDDGSLYNGIDINDNVQNGLIANNTTENVWGASMTLENNIGPCNGWTVRNNIFDSRRETGGGWMYSVYLNGITSYTFSNNTYMSPSDQPGLVAVVNKTALTGPQWAAFVGDNGSSHYNQDPQFTNVLGGNLTLLPTSPAINAGLFIAGVTFGALANMGAY